MLTRRNFNLGLTSAAFGGLALAGCGHLRDLPDYAQRIPGFGKTGMRADPSPYGELRPSPHCPQIDLPESFECRVVSALDDPMLNGTVPNHADGMGCFIVDSSHVALVRNHEISNRDFGGTTTIVYDYKAKVRREHYRSLGETMTNCAGGVTPWGTWLSCEEDLTPGHGYVYEVPALHDDRVKRKPLEQLGRFNHEAAAVDPVTGYIYMTEDQIDGLFYRFVPNDKDDSLGEGQLQVLVFDKDEPALDLRNWGARSWTGDRALKVKWEPLAGIERPLDDPRKRAHRRLGAIRFACGEGIFFGEDELYFTCTSGGLIKSGQIMRYAPNRRDEVRGTLELFLESTEERDFNFGDNLVIAPNGHLLVCEDPYFGGEGNFALRDITKFLKLPSAPCYLRGVTPAGEVYDLARLRGGSELAGVCFSPGGKVMFLNIYDPAATLAIWGPWNPPPRSDWLPYAASAVGRAALP